MGWSFTSNVSLGLPSWSFYFFMTFWLLHEFSHSIHGSWTYTLKYISYRLKLNNLEMMFPTMTWHFDKKWQDIDDIGLTMRWKCKETLCCYFLSIFLINGICSSSSSSSWLENKDSIMWIWSSLFCCTLAFLHSFTYWSSYLFISIGFL